MVFVKGEVAAGETSVYGPTTLVAICSMPFVQVITTMLVPRGLIVTGSSMGRKTDTVKLHVLELPQASTEVAITVLVVFGKKTD